MIEHVKSYLRKNYLAAFFILGFFIIIAWKMTAHPTPFYDWDESIYAQVGREMITAKSLIPLWQGTIWLDKPPLVPLVYGIVLKAFFFMPPEISTRLFTLLLSSIALFLIYHLYFKVTNNRIVSTLAIILTALNPIFLQRAQVLNIDIFVLIAWLGYLIAFPNFWLSFFFLFIGVMSKSLIGFYPLALWLIYAVFEYLTKKITKRLFIKYLRIAALQIGILAVYFIVMFILFGHNFWQNQIIEAHFRRVTASIESHFGKRTYYLDLIFEQFGVYAYAAFFSIIFLVIQFVRKKVSALTLFLSLSLIPWFIFLNLTKTKIFWYIYPVIPQFTFLIVFPVTLLRKFKRLFFIAVVLILIFIFKDSVLNHDYLSQNYSKNEDYLSLANYAKSKCNNLHVLVGPETRQTFSTLEKMNLLISTSRWWGNHPSMVYYFEKKVIFEYDKTALATGLQKFKPGECLSLEKNDLNLSPSQQLKFITSFNNYFLYEKL